jgi:homoserine kinase type II
MTAALPDPAPLLAAYDLAPPVVVFALAEGGTNNETVGVRTGAGDFVWKRYRTSNDPAVLRYEGRLLDWLARQHLPFAVPAPIPDRSGATLNAAEGGWQALFPFLPGRRPDRRDPAQLVAVGAALGELHRAFARYPAAPRPNRPAYGDLDRLHPAISSPESLTPGDFGPPDQPSRAHLVAWWREELGRLWAFAGGPYRALPWQMIHGDFSIGNTFFHDGRLAAIFDFEFAAPDARALDVAAGLEFAIRYWEGGTPEEWWAIAAAFCRGYGRVNTLTEPEIAAIPRLIRLRDAASVIWHTGQGLARDRVPRGLISLEHLRGTARWLEAHERELVATIRDAVNQ